MEERERPRPLQAAASSVVTEGGGNEDVVRQMGALLETARVAISSRLSSDSRRYVRSAAQHGGQ